MSRTITLGGFGLLAAGAAVLELSARRLRRPAPFGAVLAWALRRIWLRLAVLAGWLWLGWHLFVRVDP